MEKKYNLQLVINKIIVVSFFLFLFCLPLNVDTSNIFLVVALAVFFLSYPFVYKSYLGMISGKKRWLTLFSSVFVIYLFTLVSGLWTDYPDLWKKFLEYRASFLLVPLMFFLGFRLSSNQYRFVLNGLVFGVALGFTLFFLNSICGLSSFEKWVPQQHPTYFSFYGFFALVVLTGTPLRYFSCPWADLVFKVVFSVLVLWVILFIGQRVPVFLSLAYMLVFPFVVIKKKLYRLLVLGGFILIVAAGTVVMQKTGRWETVISKFELTRLEIQTQASQVGGFESRLSRWIVALDPIAQKPWTGYGAGAEKEVLAGVYERENMVTALENRYDIHSQPLSLTLESGILAGLFYLYMMGLMLLKSIGDRNLVAVCFTLSVLFMSFFENILNVNAMITLFTFFSSLYIFSTKTSDIPSSFQSCETLARK